MAKRTIRKIKPGTGDHGWRIVMDPSPVALARSFGKLSKDLRSWKRAWPDVSKVMVVGLKRTLKSRGSDINRPWGSVGKRYAKWKARRGKGRAELIYKGKMLKQLDRRNGIRRATRTALSVGVKTKYAKAVHFGRKPLNPGRHGRWGYIKPRRFIEWTANTSVAVVNALQKHADDLLLEFQAAVAASKKKR